MEAGKDINLASGGDLVADIDGGVTIDTEGDINLLAPVGDLNAGIGKDVILLAGGDLNAVIVNDFNLGALGRVFIEQGTTGNKGYLTGTCENASGPKKDICQG